MQDSISKDSALKVAIIRLSSLGDIVSSVVFLDLLRAKFAQNGRKIDISFIVDSQFKGILENSLLVDKIIDLPLRAGKKNKRLIFSVIKKVRSLGHFDKVIDAQGLLKSALIGKMLKKSAFIGYDKDSIREKIASFFYTKKATIAYNEHILKRQYELFKVAFDEVAWENDFRLEMLDSRECAMDSSPKAKTKIAQILAPHKANKKILFLCETSKADKEFSLDSFYALAEGLWSDYKDATIFLIWDKKESEIRALGEKDSRFCVLPHLDFDEIKALLASMDLVIGGDTGITHSAWAMRVPSVTIYISTDIKRFVLEGDKHFSILVGNSSLGMQFRTCENFGDFADSKSSLNPQNSHKYKSHTANTRICDLDSSESSLRGKAEAIHENNIDCHDFATQNLAMTSGDDSSLRENERSEFSWQSKQNNLRDSATESRPIRGAKNRIQGCSSATADFLLESELRGSPPKSEKAVAFWRVGGAGRGVQPFLREKIGESNSKQIVGDSNVAKMDSSLTAFAQNDESLDCHENSLRSFSRNDGMGIDSHNAESIANSTLTAQIAQIIKFAKKVLQ